MKIIREIKNQKNIDLVVDLMIKKESIKDHLRHPTIDVNLKEIMKIKIVNYSVI
jgi:hypothetical protein